MELKLEKVGDVYSLDTPPPPPSPGPPIPDPTLVSFRALNWAARYQAGPGLWLLGACIRRGFTSF